MNFFSKKQVDEEQIQKESALVARASKLLGTLISSIDGISHNLKNNNNGNGKPGHIENYNVISQAAKTTLERLSRLESSLYNLDNLNGVDSPKAR